MSTDVDADVALLLETVDQFAARAGQRLFGQESPDGDLEAIGDLLLDAASVGLLADVDAEVGHWGVWGAHADEEGAALSLAVLRRLGRVCAGLATAVHAQGLGVRLLAASTPTTTWPAGVRLTAAFCPPYGLALDPRTAADGMQLDGDRLTGTARFALAADAAEAVVLAVHARSTTAAADDARAVVCLPSSTPGLRIVSTGHRIGLRATTMVDVVADDVTVPDEALRHAGPAAAERLRTTVATDWLGQAAIALGCAEQAVAVARDYTQTRVQGGVPISEHAAIRLLLSRAEHDADVVAAVLERHAGTPLRELDPTTLLLWAIDARLAAASTPAGP